MQVVVIRCEYDRTLFFAQVSITKTKLKVGLKGSAPVLDGDLFSSVKPEDCYWNISDGKVVELTLQKVCPQFYLISSFPWSWP